MPNLLQDIRYGVRTALRSPGFSFVSVLALALGIGANTAIFSVVNAVLLRPLPYASADRLLEVWEANNSGGWMSVAYPDYIDWKHQTDAFEEIAAWAAFPATMTGKGPAQRIDANYVSANFLRTFEVKPLFGRDFSESDDRDGAPPVAILGYEFWQRRFGASNGVLGQALTLDKTNHTIIAVMPRSFKPYRRADVYVPVGTVARRFLLQRGNHDSMSAIARRKPGVTLEKVQAQMNTIAQRLAKQYPETNTGVGVAVTPVRRMLASDAKKPVLILLGAVGLVLLIACVNVANMLLARSAARQKEIAIRAALGASRGRLVRQLLTESTLLSLAGGALGLLLAKWSFAGLTILVPSASTMGGLSLDYRVLLFVALIALATGILFGLAPSLHASRTGLAGAMKAGGRGVGGAESRRTRNVLVVAEIALAFVLLAAAGLLIRSFSRLLNVNPGFRSEHVVAMRVTMPESPDLPLNAFPRFYKRILDRVEKLPGVAHAGVVRHLHFTAGSSWQQFYLAGRPVPARGEYPSACYKVATPGFFRALGIPLLKGRFFTPADGEAPALTLADLIKAPDQMRLTAVISESMAKKYWPNEDPVGKQFRMGTVESNDPWVTVLGVVGDAKASGLDSQIEPTFYYSGYAYPDNNLWLVIRAHRDPLSLVSAARGVVQEVDRDAPVTDVQMMDQIVSDSLSWRRSNTALLSIFAGLALLLSAVGVYGVMAYAVTRRTQEIGVRVALGATRGDVLWLVVREGVVLAGIGVTIGIAAAAGLVRLISSMLYGVKATDPATFGGACVVVIGFALLASCIPARRAMRVDPIIALRYE